MKEIFDSLPKKITIKQENLINSLYTILEKEGIINTNIEDEYGNQKEYYKNTRLLLKNYRSLIFALSYTGVEISEELNCKSLTELERVIAHYRDFSSFGNKIPEPIAARLEANIKAIRLINRLRKSLTILKQKPYCYNGTTRTKVSGKTEFQALYYSYIEMPASFCTSELIKQSNELLLDEDILNHKEDICSGVRSDEDIAFMLHVSNKDFLAIRKAAIEDLSSILWGGYTREISYIIDFLGGLDIDVDNL